MAEMMGGRKRETGREKEEGKEGGRHGKGRKGEKEMGKERRKFLANSSS